MALMFDRLDVFNNGGVSLKCWDVSSATNLNYMFHMSDFNHDITNWCVENFWVKQYCF